MRETTFDPARRLDIYLRVNRAGNKTFTFYQTDGETPYSLEDITFQLNIKKNSGERTNVIQLTSGSGLTIANNVLMAEVTEVQTKINTGTYYWELYRSDTKKTWLSGIAYFHDGPFDGVSEDEEDINIVDNSQSATFTQLNLPSSGVIYFGDSSTDGSWRIMISGVNLIFERRDSGVWTTYNSLGS